MFIAKQNLNLYQICNMSTNIPWNNYDPYYPEGVDFVSIWVEEEYKREPFSFEEWMKQEWISPLDWWTEDYYKEYLEEFNI